MEVGKFLMLGIITDDVEKSVESFKQFGFQDWNIEKFDSDFIPDVLLNNEPGRLVFIGAQYRSQNINIELLQPVSESIYMDYLRSHGPGVHHMEFEPKDGYETFMRDYRAAGHDVLLEADFAGGKAGFAFLDTEKLLGFRLEIHK